jgi:CubicO group peptidase (beta-lactamase class C family)
VLVRVDSTSPVASAVGTYRWAGAYGTYFWIDRKTDLIRLMWSQASFGPESVALERRFERLVYDAITRP